MPVSQQAIEQVDAADDTVGDISYTHLWSVPLPKQARKGWRSGHAVANANSLCDCYSITHHARVLKALTQWRWSCHSSSLVLSLGA